MTFAAAAARRVHQRIRIVRIEALGDYRGQWAFCDRAPAYVAALSADEAALYKAWFRAGEGPRQVPSEVHPFGGVEEAGELPVTIVDGVGPRAGGDRDALTARLRTDALPDLQLDAAIDGTTAAAILISGPASVIATIAVKKTVLFLGVEAMRVDAVVPVSATQILVDVSRHFLDTDAQPHDAGASIYLYPPFMEGRKVRLFYTFDDATLTPSDETEIGQGWRIENDELDDDLGSYVLSCLSSQGPIDRLIASKAYSGTVLRVGTGSLPNVKLRLDPEVQRWADEALHFGDGIWLQHGDEIVFASQLALDHWSVLARGCIRTTEATFDADEDVRQVFCAYGGPVAGVSGRSSFAFQVRGTETVSRGTGTWIRDERAEHPVPAMLCVLTSSSTPDGADGLGGTNYVAGKGNYSVLPMGVGAGVPANEIDFDSFIAIWDRFPEWRATGIVLSKAITAREFCETLARLFGFTITMRAGKLRADVATIPTAGTTAAVKWGLDEILTEEVEPGLERSRLKVRRASDLSAKVLKYVTTRPSGREHDVIFRDGDFPLLAGQIRGRFTGETAPVEIDAHAIWADSAGGARTLYERAMRLFFYIRRPPLEVKLFTDLRYVAEAFVSQFALITHPEIADRTRGQRGVEDALAWIVRKAIDEESDEVEWTALLLGTGGKFAKVSPAARVTWVVGTTATCRANRYTDPANTLGLPTSDVGGFAIGDVCVLVDVAGKRISAATETVTAIGVNTLQFSGTFGGTLAAGVIVKAALWDSETSTQKTSFVSYADSTTEGLGAAEDAAFTYGER